jgi:hypothetical protein
LNSIQECGAGILQSYSRASKLRKRVTSTGEIPMVWGHDTPGALERGQKPLHDPAVLTCPASSQKFRGCNRIHPKEVFSADSGQDKSERPVAEIIDPDRRIKEEIQRMGL